VIIVLKSFSVQVISSNLFALAFFRSSERGLFNFDLAGLVTGRVSLFHNLLILVLLPLTVLRLVAQSPRGFLSVGTLSSYILIIA
jgi:hypothetical protein